MDFFSSLLLVIIFSFPFSAFYLRNEWTLQEMDDNFVDKVYEQFRTLYMILMDNVVFGSFVFFFFSFLFDGFRC